jgi:hypothetical protein
MPAVQEFITRSHKEQAPDPKEDPVEQRFVLFANP